MKPIEPLLNRSFSIMRTVRVADGQGGWISSWHNMGSVLGRLSPVAAAEVKNADQQQSRVTHMFYTGGTEDVVRNDHVIASDLTFEVLAVMRTSEPGHHLECSCREIQVEPEEVTS